MQDIPRLPEVAPSEILALLASVTMTAPPPDLLDEPNIKDVVDQLPEGRSGFLKITYDLDQFDKKNEIGVAFVHKFNDHVSVQAYGGYNFTEGRGAHVRAELLWEW